MHAVCLHLHVTVGPQYCCKAVRQLNSGTCGLAVHMVHVAFAVCRGHSDADQGVAVGLQLVVLSPVSALLCFAYAFCTGCMPLLA